VTAQDSPDAFNVGNSGWNDPAVVFPTSLTNNFSYKSAGNEVNLSTSGDHTITLTAVDSNAHTQTVKTKAFIFASVPTCVSTSASTTPLYTWSGVPATADAIFLTVQDGVFGNTVYGCVLPPTATTFQHPADFPLTSATGYQWKVSVIHFIDASLKGGGDQQGEATALNFTTP
jgi:hypothetical protein